jgi:pimeloyl-ACP methyl ester carboxylesterase
MSCDQYFLCDGARLRYRDEGTGPAVVLVHGWTLDLEMWDPQVDSLRAHFRIIRFDRRGFGLSSGSTDLSQDATDLISLCHHLHAGPIGCVGMSQGARVVLALARLQPQLLARLVLDGPPELVVTPDRGTDDLNYAQLKALAQNQGLEEFRRVWARHPLTALETSDRGRHELLQRMIARYRGGDLLSSSDTRTHSSSHTDSSSEFIPAAITQPALVLNGALDTPGRLHAAETLARALPNCERAIVPAGRHLANLDNPSAYNSLLLQFFSASH